MLLKAIVIEPNLVVVISVSEPFVISVNKESTDAMVGYNVPPVLKEFVSEVTPSATKYFVESVALGLLFVLK